MSSINLKKTVKNLTYHSDSRLDEFLSLNEKDRVQVFQRLSRNIQKQLISQLENGELIKILSLIGPDEATDLLRTLNKKRQDAIVSDMSNELRGKITMLLEFDPKTAAGLMSLNYVQVNSKEKLSNVAKIVDRHETRTGKLPTVLVIDDTKLKGYIPLQRLLFTNPSEKAEKVTQKALTIKYSLETDKVIDTFVNHPHQKVVVLDDNEAILGILYSDDVLQTMHKKNSSSLYNFAGLNKEEAINDSIMLKVKHRYKWLIVNLGTAFMAAFTVGLFNDTISKHVLLVAYMPIVAGMGGNAATQTLAVIVRGISQNEVQLDTAVSALISEIGTGFINGAINGLIVFTITFIINGDIGIAFVLALAMIINLVVAGFFGTLVPLLMTKLGKDPATSATIFITTATDVLGFLAFLGLASVLL